MSLVAFDTHSHAMPGQNLLHLVGYDSIFNGYKLCTPFKSEVCAEGANMDYIANKKFRHLKHNEIRHVISLSSRLSHYRSVGEHAACYMHVNLSSLGKTNVLYDVFML